MLRAIPLNLQSASANFCTTGTQFTIKSLTRHHPAARGSEGLESTLARPDIEGCAYQLCAKAGFYYSGALVRENGAADYNFASSPLAVWARLRWRGTFFPCDKCTFSLTLKEFEGSINAVLCLTCRSAPSRLESLFCGLSKPDGQSSGIPPNRYSRRIDCGWMPHPSHLSSWL